MTVTLPLWPIQAMDILGCLAMILLAGCALYRTRRLLEAHGDDILCRYLAWLTGSFFAFSLFRSLGHLVRHVLLAAGLDPLWQRLSPVSGGLNTITFIVVFAVTLFFRDVYRIMQSTLRDKERIEETSRQLLTLNEDLEAIVTDRTRYELALRLGHELRNPIMIIGGLLRRLLPRLERDEKAKRQAETILEQIAGLEAMLLEFDRQQVKLSKHFGQTEINQLLRRSMHILRPLAQGRQVRLEARLAESALTLSGDPHLLLIACNQVLRQVIRCLRPGGTVILTSGMADGHIEIETSGAPLEREGTDTDREAGDDADVGTALETAVVQQIVRQHRGRLVVECRGDTLVIRILLPTHLAELETL